MKNLLLFIAAFAVSAANAQNFQWARITGTSYGTNGTGMATDKAGNTYATGQFQGSVDFDPGPAYDWKNSTNGTFFITKLDANGSYCWTRQVDDIYPAAVACDDTGAVYVAGFFGATMDLDPDPGTVNNVSAVGSYDSYVMKINSNGSLAWVRVVGTPAANCRAKGINVDNWGNVYVNGIFTNTVDFDPGAGTSNLTSSQATNVFLLKLNSQGNFKWARSQTFDGQTNLIYRIATDRWGNVFSSSDHDSISVTKFDSLGNLIWSLHFFEHHQNRIFDLATDKNGNLVIVGSFVFNNDFDPGSGYHGITADGGDAFVLKLDSAGNFLWVNNFRGPGNDIARSVAIDSNDLIFVAGHFEILTDFDAGLNSQYYMEADSGSGTYRRDAFVVKLGQAGELMFAKRIGGPEIDNGLAVGLDSVNNVYFMGNFQDTVDFDPGAGTNVMHCFCIGTGATNFFVVKLSSSGLLNLPELTPASAHILIYPNPATDELTIKTEGQYQSYTISNSLGQQVLKANLATNEIRVDIRNIPPGLYYLNISGESGTEVRKFVKM